MATTSDATRKNYRDHGAPLRGLYFGRNPRRPNREPKLVQIVRHGRGLTLRGAEGETVDSFGDTAVFWLAPAPELRAPRMTCHRDKCDRDLAEHHSSDRLPGGYCDTDAGREIVQLHAWNKRHNIGNGEPITLEGILAARDTDHAEAVIANAGPVPHPRLPEVSHDWLHADDDERETLLSQAHREALAENENHRVAELPSHAEWMRSDESTRRRTRTRDGAPRRTSLSPS